MPGARPPRCHFQPLTNPQLFPAGDGGFFFRERDLWPPLWAFNCWLTASQSCAPSAGPSAQLSADQPATPPPHTHTPACHTCKALLLVGRLPSSPLVEPSHRASSLCQGRSALHLPTRTGSCLTLSCTPAFPGVLGGGGPKAGWDVTRVLGHSIQDPGKEARYDGVPQTRAAGSG